jgi:hypothetical protein
MATNERIHFRLIVCAHCSHNLCWVNPRLPNHCPECGAHIYPEVRGMIWVSDPEAWIRYDATRNQDAAERGPAETIGAGRFIRSNP